MSTTTKWSIYVKAVFKGWILGISTFHCYTREKVQLVAKEIDLLDDFDI